ncbi:MAG: hypothetical protein GF320_10940 [Armatimonadia bacterium]|nr:hypothetical protein [Armatimonadia bacterium]
MGDRGYFDIAPFATEILWEDPVSTGLRWEEPRRIHRLVLQFAGSAAIQPPESLGLQYWHNYWPETGEHDRSAAELGWAPSEDWYNGRWQDADTSFEETDRGLVLAFEPLSRKEFPHLEGRAETYRLTNQIRLNVSEGWPAMEWIRVETVAEWESVSLRLRFGTAPMPTPLAPRAYNGRIHAWDAREREVAICADVILPTSLNGPPDPAEDTIISLGGDEPRLSFHPRQVMEHGTMVIPSHGVVIDAPGVPSDAPPEVPCVYDRIHTAPEQSFGAALAAMPPADPLHFVLGCPGARQKFRLEPSGELLLPRNYIERVEGADTGGMLWEGTLRVDMGLPGRRPERRRVDGYLPVLVSTWQADGVTYELTSFAAPLHHRLGDGDLPGDATIVAVLDLRLTTTDEAEVRLPLDVSDDGGPNLAGLHDDLLWGRCGDQLKLRARVIADGLEWDQSALRARLGAGESVRCSLVIPAVTPTDKREFEALDGLDVDRALEDVLTFWRSKLGSGLQIRSPEPGLDDFHRAHLSHMLITDDREPGSDLVHTRVGSFHYGNYANESCMVISSLDRRGLHNEARRRLETFLHYQGTVPLPGNYTTSEGVFHGSGGYECGGYNQHHGWVLWALGEHYRLTRDDAWLERAAPGMLAGADWITSERQATLAYDDTGSRLPEWGLLPAGSLEDVTDFQHWLSTNAFSYYGLRSVADALTRGRHPEAGRILDAAEAYRRDIEDTFERQAARAPVVCLRDGTWVPHYPSRVYRRGRDVGWIRETLEGALHLVCCGVVDPGSDVATWILKDYEDNRYVRAPFGYHIADERFERDWFSLGGFSMQPNLLWGPVTYLLRDEVKHFLRAFFNGLASAWRCDVRMLTEHPLPELGCNQGDHFKTSDEAQAAHWLRMMLLRENVDDLWIGQAVPRGWMASSQAVEIERCATWFGPAGFRVEHSGERTVMELDPPTRNLPRRLVLRLRHPDGRPFTRVTMDGRAVDTIDPERELVEIDCPPQRPVTVEAWY